MDTSDIATALAASIERVVEEHCQAIAREAEKVIAAFRMQATRLAGAPPKPAPRPAPPPPPEIPDEEYEPPPLLAARVLEI